MAKKDLKVGKSTHKLLEYVFEKGCITRKQAILCLGGKKKIRTAEISLRELLDREYIAPLLPWGKKYNGGKAENKLTKTTTYYVITEEGIRHLGKIDQMMKNVIAFTRAETSLAKAKEDEARNDIEALIHGTGVYTHKFYKPSFQEFCWLMNEELKDPAEIPEDYASVEISEIPELLESGLYYTSSEMKDGFAVLGIDDDNFFMSRCMGAVFKTEDIYMIYRFDDRGYMVSYQMKEQALIDELKRTLPYYKYTPICVMMCKTYSAAAAICTGHKNGRNREEEKYQRKKTLEMEELSKPLQILYERDQEERRRYNKTFVRNSRDDIRTLTGNTRLFKAIYCAPVTIPGSDTTRYILTHNIYNIPEEGREWFGNHPGFSGSLSSEGPIITGLCEKTDPWSDAVYVPVIDCKMLTGIRIFHIHKHLSIVTHPELADAVSRIIGPAAFAFYDMDGTEIRDVQRYKETGFPVGEDKYEILANRKKAKAQERKTAGFRRKESFTVAIDPGLKVELRKMAKKEGMSLAGYAGRIMEQYVTRIMQTANTKS